MSDVCRLCWHRIEAGVGVKLGEPGRQKLDRQRFWTMQSRVLSCSSINPFTAVLITTPSLGNRPIKALDLKSLRSTPSPPFACARERTSIRKHSIESRSVTGASVYIYISVCRRVSLHLSARKAYRLWQ